MALDSEHAGETEKKCSESKIRRIRVPALRTNLTSGRGWGYLTKFEFRQTLTARSLLLVPLSVKTPLGRSTSRYFDRRQAYFDFRIQLKFKILTPLKIVRKFLTKIFLDILRDKKSNRPGADRNIVM